VTVFRIDRDEYVGPSEAIEGYLKLTYPIGHGMIEDWDAMEKVRLIHGPTAWNRCLYSAAWPAATREILFADKHTPRSCRFGITPSDCSMPK